MKKTLFNYALIIASALCLSGCEVRTDIPDPKHNAIMVDKWSHLHVIDVKGHEYIVFGGGYQGGIIHSESCPCKKKENENE